MSDFTSFFPVVAKNIWNNLLERDDAKSNWLRYSNLRCPTRDRPFLATYKNSRDGEDNLGNDISDEDDDDQDPEEPDIFDYDNDEDDPYGSNNKQPFERKLIRRRKRRRKSRRSRSRNRRSPSPDPFLFQNDNTPVVMDGMCDIL